MAIYRRRRSIPRTLSIDVYSSNTTQAFDIVPQLLHAGAPYNLRMSRDHRQQWRKLESEFRVLSNTKRYWFQSATDDGAELADDICGELMDILSSYAPAFAYVGASDGDGACIGCFVSHDSVTEACRFGEIHCGEVGRHGECDGRDGAPADAEYALYCSDHGDMTLFRAVKAGKARRWVEVW